MVDIIKNLEWRYAVKKFNPEKILSEDKVEKLKKAFNLTATSYGLQPIKMLVINNKELQEKLVEYSYGQQQVAQASHVLVICMENHIDANFIADYFKRVAHIRGTNEAILHPFKASLIADFSKKNKEEIQNWAAKQAYLAMGNLLTVCAVEKIDACPMEGFVPSAYNELLGLEKEGLTSVLVLPVGYRADDDIFSKFKKVRKDIKESIIEIP